jgi:hypothetical protein
MSTIAPHTTAPRSIAGNTLMLIMSFATIATVAGIAGFCATSSWALLPVIMVSLITVAGCIVGVLGRMISDGDELG